MICRGRKVDIAQPRVFISYSWSSPSHREQVRVWAEQLVSDGIDVVLDQWDLETGDDKYAFMESMVVDSTVTHVLVFTDREYARKANDKVSGVGTESQIISREVYARVKQSKFIPVVCEKDDRGEPLLPVFFESRIWIDFSTAESANENWESLIRVLHGQPLHKKPALGKAPAYLAADHTVPASPALVKLVALKQAVHLGKAGVKGYRREFLDACYSYVDSFRTRSVPSTDELPQKTLDTCGKLKVVRDHLVDWVLLESEGDSPVFADSLISVLEKLLELKSRPKEISSFSDNWFDAHAVFVYETFIYIVAALLRNEAYSTLNAVLTGYYLQPSMSGGKEFSGINAFHGHSDLLQILAPAGRSLKAPAAELIKRQADRSDIPFKDVMQAEILILLMVMLNPGYWFPQTLFYLPMHEIPEFFLRATKHRDFVKLAQITGVSNADELRARVKDGHNRMGVNGWYWFNSFDRTFWSAMNMDKLDTL
nr:toll/interleukin-1 receptor domain-containing protein [Xanthomonas euvesicatoria]